MGFLTPGTGAPTCFAPHTTLSTAEWLGRGLHQLSTSSQGCAAGHPPAGASSSHEDPHLTSTSSSPMGLPSPHCTSGGSVSTGSPCPRPLHFLTFQKGPPHCSGFPCSSPLLPASPSLLFSSLPTSPPQALTCLQASCCLGPELAAPGQLLQPPCRVSWDRSGLLGCQVPWTSSG